MFDNIQDGGQNNYWKINEKIAFVPAVAVGMLNVPLEFTEGTKRIFV